MTLDGILFLFFLLPASILAFAMMPVRLRPTLLLLISWGFYYLVERRNLLLLISVLLFDYFMAWLLQRSTGYPRLRRLIVFCSVGKTVGLFAFYSISQQLAERHFPLGLGVYLLISTGYVLEFYHGQTSFERSLPNFLLMGSFFPSLYAGPLVQHVRFAPQTRNMRFSLVRLGEGSGTFLCGMAKKLLLGDPVRVLFLSLQSAPYLQCTTLAAWAMVLTLFLAIYFQLSGFCDMARGLGMIFGLDLPENFFYPCRAKSVNEFLARFNATVSRYLRRNVYLSLGGAQGGVLSSSFNIVLVSILMGLWFGFGLNHIAWGACLALFVLVEKFLFPAGWSNVSAFFRWLYCAVAVTVSFAFFAGDTLSASFYYLRAMFGLTNTVAADNRTMYLLASNHMVLLLAIILATGLPREIGRRLQRRLPNCYQILSIAGSAFLLVGITAMLV